MVAKMPRGLHAIVHRSTMIVRLIIPCESRLCPGGGTGGRGVQAVGKGSAKGGGIQGGRGVAGVGSAPGDAEWDI